MNKRQLASTIWKSANEMRSKIEANEYKDYILGFIFYRYLSEKELRFFKEQGMTDEDIRQLDETDEDFVNYTKDTIGYFIAYENLFSTWLDKGSDFDVSDVRKALSAFNRLISDSHKKVFEKIFNTLQTGLSKLGETASTQTKSINNLIKLIKRIPMDGKQDYDVLGFIYEYLISQFAANAGKKAGEFYTPHEVSVLMSEIVAEHLKDRQEIRIYDPTSGSGSLLINIGSAVAKYLKGDNRINYYAQELKENTYNLTRMNLVMRGIDPANIYVRNGDTLEEDWPFFENDDIEHYQLVRVDAVVSNPPYSQKWDTKNKKHDPRFSDYGVAPKGKADYAFLLHELYHLEDDGIMTIGKEVSLKIYDRREIAFGSSRYQIVRQPIFKTAPRLNDRRGDLMLLINGMPVIHIELKKSGIPVSNAYNQIEKYAHEGVFTGLFSLIQVFVAMEPAEAVYFANPGPDGVFNKSFYFHWADFDNVPYSDWQDAVKYLLNIPMAHELIGYYTIPDAKDDTLKVMRSYQYRAAKAI